MVVTAKSLILDLLSTLKGGAMPVRALVQAGVIFGLEENGVRVALARLRAAGLVERDDRGQYRLGARTRALAAQIGGWRTTEERLRRWSGAWIAVHGGPAGGRRRDLARRARALRLFGFRPLLPGLEIRPDNLAGGIDALRPQLHALGLAPTTPIFVIQALDRPTETRARALWDVAALRAEYRAGRRALAASIRRLPGLAAPTAMVESFVLGGRIIRQLVLDPLLPEPLVPAGERRALVAAMRLYDRAGRARWAAFLREFGVLHDRTPAHIRLAEAPRALVVGHARGAAA